MTAPVRHVALLRGINIGGRNKVPMAELRTLASELGWTGVATYINSGNVVFTSPKPDADLAAELTAGIAERFGAAIGVVVAGRDLVRRAAEEHPFADGDPKRVHVGFSSVPVSDAVLARLREVATGSERVDADGTLLWLDFADGVAGSKLGVRLTTALKPGFVTARNLQTVRTLLAMLDA